MSAGASPMSPLGCGARHGACQREVRGGAPGTRRVERPSPSSPRAPEPSVGAPVPRRPLAPCVPRSGRAPRGRLRHDLAEREEREHDQGDDAEDEHERAPPSAPGGGAMELPLFTGRAGGGPRPSPSRPRESPARRVPAAEGGLRATPHRGRSQAKRAWPDANQLCPSPRSGEGAPAPPSEAGEAGPAAEQVAAAPKASCGGEGPYTETGLRVDQGLVTSAASERRPSCQAALCAPTARAMKACHGAMPSDSRARPAPRTWTRTTRATTTGPRSSARSAPP